MMLLADVDPPTTFERISTLLIAVGSFLGVLYTLYKQFKTDNYALETKQAADAIQKWKDYATKQEERANGSDNRCAERIDKLEKSHEAEVKEYREKIEEQQRHITSLERDNARNAAWIDAIRESLGRRGFKFKIPDTGTDLHKPLPPEGTGS